MEAAAETFTALAADFPAEATYVFPNAFNRRVLITLNLREAFHFCQLRSAPNAHFSIRRMAVRMFELIGAAAARVAPLRETLEEARRELGLEVVACDTAVRLAGLDPEAILSSIDRIVTLPSLWKAAQDGRPLVI